MKKEWSNISLLVLRIILGAIFLYHGWPKLLNPPALLGMPTFVIFLVGVVEVLFGVLLILGIGFPWATYPLMAVIVVAFVFVQLPRGVTSGSERDLLILAVLFVLSAIGFGKYAVQKHQNR